MFVGIRGLKLSVGSLNHLNIDTKLSKKKKKYLIFVWFWKNPFWIYESALDRGGAGADISLLQCVISQVDGANFQK